MGLDMYLKAERYISGSEFGSAEEQATYAKGLETAGLTKKNVLDGSKSLSICVTVGYWRKVNSIHNWFVRNVQAGIDECQKTRVSRESLQKLLEVCEEVIADPSRAPELLPTAPGFFFGSSEINEYYLEGIKDTVRILKNALGQDFKLFENFTYQSSW